MSMVNLQYTGSREVILYAGKNVITNFTRSSVTHTVTTLSPLLGIWWKFLPRFKTFLNIFSSMFFYICDTARVRTQYILKWWSCSSWVVMQVSGSLMNTGHDIRLVLDESSSTSSSSSQHVNISGGPLSYHYRVGELVVHFGSVDSRGSEHTIDARQFPAEVSAACMRCGRHVRAVGKETRGPSSG